MRMIKEISVKLFQYRLHTYIIALPDIASADVDGHGCFGRVRKHVRSSACSAWTFLDVSQFSFAPSSVRQSWRTMSHRETSEEGTLVCTVLVVSGTATRKEREQKTERKMCRQLLTSLGVHLCDTTGYAEL